MAKKDNLIGFRAPSEKDKERIKREADNLNMSMFELVEAGIDGVSLHMDTTQSQQYKRLTRGKISSAEAIKPVWQAVAANIPTTIICVMQEETKNEVMILAGLAKHYPLDVKFAEVRPIRWCHEAVPYSKEEALKRMKISYPDLESVGEDELSDGTEFYKSAELKGRIGIMNDGKNVLHVSNTGKLSRGFGEVDYCDLMPLLRGNGRYTACRSGGCRRPLCPGPWPPRRNPG